MSEHLVWEENEDPTAPGWLVYTENAGWQPLGGGLDSDSTADPTSHEMQEQARKVRHYHDRGATYPY